MLPRPYLTWFLPGVGPRVVRDISLGLTEDNDGDKFVLPPSSFAGVGPRVVRDISLGLTEDKDGDRFILPPSSFAGVGPKTDEESSLGFGLTEVGESEENKSSSTTSGNLLIDPTTKKILK